MKNNKAIDHTIDFMDINWVIDHVHTLKQRIDVLRDLGFKIGYNVYINEKSNFIKSITIGKRNEMRIQVSDHIKGFPLVYCVIINDEDEQ